MLSETFTQDFTPKTIGKHIQIENTVSVKLKFEWRKHEKALYGAKSIPVLVDIPIQNFIMIKGSGNPNDSDFSGGVAALYSLAYAVKMGYKSTATKNFLSNEIHDFTVYPLEGIWKQKNDDKESAAGKLIKENLEYTIMIRQPDFITAEMVCAVLERRQKNIL